MSWQVKPISDLGKVVTGKTPSTKNRDFYDGEFPFVTPTDLDWHSYFVRTTHSTITKLSKDQHKNQMLPAGATTFTCIGNTIGKCGITSEMSLTNQQINSIVPNEEHDGRFVYYLMLHNKDAIRSIGLSGGAAQPIINKTTFSNVKVCVPSLHTQERIAGVLSAYDDLIENNRRRIALLEQAARLLYREWFVHFRFPGHETSKFVNGLPEGWKRMKLADASQYISRGIAPKYDDEANGLVINQKCIRDNRATLQLARKQSKRVPDKKLVQALDVLVNSTGKGTLGRIAQFHGERDNLTVDSHVSIVRPSESVDPFWFGAAVIEKETLIETLGKGSTSQTELSKEDLGRVGLVVPDRGIQCEFSLKVAPTRKQVEQLLLQNDKLAKARDLLLPRLMDGRIPV
ncbi:restriction endonuclease subunit S [Cohaesibacter intestini]|uniref:restriction endonuclease subunit S n=1 Tax=Cohaesibacter intestini TaxID=2211145 RepID=UPI000DE91BB3|nr:restriction endonuclease subunit S [Cohaesibacter intestini]